MAQTTKNPNITTTDVSRALDRNFDARASGTRVALTTEDRDAIAALIDVLQADGWKLSDIAGALSMSASAVTRSLQRNVKLTGKARADLKTWASQRIKRLNEERSTSNLMVEATNVTKRFGQTVALDNVSFGVSSGITGLLGPNGAGKTTFIKLALGILRPDEGHLKILGGDPSSTKLRARIGWVAESDTFWPDAKGIDIVGHFGELHGLTSTDATTRAGEVLNLLSMGEERNRQYKTLSTGQKQRIKLGAAIVHDPDLVLLDEPTNGLDPVQREAMLSMIRRIGHEIGISVLLSSHLLDEVERTVDSVIIIDEGAIRTQSEIDVLSGTTGKILVDIAGDVARFVRVLKKSGAKVELIGESVSVVNRGDVTYDHILDAAVETKVGIRRMTKARKSLEDVFLTS